MNSYVHVTFRIVIQFTCIKGALRYVVVAVNTKTHYLRLLCGDGVLPQSNQIIFAEAPRRTARIFFWRISLCQLQVQSTDDDLPERSVDTEMRVGKKCISELNINHRVRLQTRDLLTVDFVDLERNGFL